MSDEFSEWLRQSAGGGQSAPGLPVVIEATPRGDSSGPQKSTGKSKTYEDNSASIDDGAPPPEKPTEPEIETGRREGEVGFEGEYHPDAHHKIYQLCLLGMTTSEICRVLRITPQLLWQWSRRDRRIRDAFEAGRHLSDGQVAEALFNRAKGMSVRETQIIKLKREIYDDRGKVIGREEFAHPVEVVTELPPDTKAIALWLSNRRNASRARHPWEQRVTVTAQPETPQIEAKKFETLQEAADWYAKITGRG